MLFITGCSGGTQNSSREPVEIRLGVALTPQELATFQPAIEAIEQDHPEWKILLETTPQSGVVEKINTQLAARDLPDVLRIQGLLVQQWIRKDAFVDLSPYISDSQIGLTDFYPGPLEQFEWQGKYWGLPDTAAPDVVFYNKDMFDRAGLAYPDDAWTYEDMRSAAIQLTQDDRGRSADDPDFDPQNIQEWGWNGGLTFFWQRHLVRTLGGDFCANLECTLMDFTSTETVNAVQWWADLVSEDHAALYDPYGGSQTGLPGDPFINGKSAMGYNGFFAVGQLNATGNIDYDITQPFIASDGNRYTPLSTTGYVIASNSEHPDQAWRLIQELLEAQFLIETWGKPGHSVPARRSAAGSVINPESPPHNQQAILAAMEYGEVFKPFTSSAFEVHAKTGDLFLQTMKGELPVADALAEIESIANEILAKDREP